MRFRYFRHFMGGIVCALMLSRAAAAVPSLVNFQGKLLDTSKNPRNGVYNMTFSVWDASSGGSQVWSETQSNVPVSNGVFSVQLGAVSPLSSSVFDGPVRYLQVEIGGETATTRQRLVTSPYAYRASVADDVAGGSANYIQNTGALQPGATFHVSSGTVTGPLKVGGVLVVGSGNNQITDAAGLLDATKLTGTIPDAQISGIYSNALLFDNAANLFVGDGSGLTEVTASELLAGDTDYIQNRDTLQTGASFYVAKGSISGPLNAAGTVSLGGAAGVDDVTINSNLIVSGAGPHVLTGDVRINGNDIQDSAGVSRISLGADTAVTGNLTGGAGQPGLQLSTPTIFTGGANGDNYIAYPFTTGSGVTNRDIVIISGANTVDATTTANSANAVGIAVNTASAGNTVWVATSGIVTGVVTAGAVTVGQRVCTTTTSGSVDNCTTAGAAVGKALTGSSGAGQTITVILWQGS